MDSAVGSPSKRRKRTSTATQACEACRRRKLKCDELRPRCANCRDLEGVCEYRESVPIKIDRATTQVLEKLSEIETKIDYLALSDATMERHAVSTSTPGAAIKSLYSESDHMSLSRASSERSDRHEASIHQMDGSLTQRRKSQGSLTQPHKILLWPIIRNLVFKLNIRSGSNLPAVWQEGTAWFIKRELMDQTNALPSRIDPLCTPLPQAHDMDLATFADLNVAKVEEYTNAYFNTFNLLFPVLSRTLFEEEIISPLLQAGYVDTNHKAVLALFVIALGQLSIEGALHDPVSFTDGEPSGIRGASIQQPSGLAKFNEARRRLGSLSMHNSLEKVQALLLQATYFEACSQHTDHWHSIVSASMACMVLIKCRSADWTSVKGDLIKRAYWTCVLHEELFHVDLDLPSTAVVTMEDAVPLPHFHELQEGNYPDYSAGHPSQRDSEIYTSYFLAMIALRRIIGRTYEALQYVQHPSNQILSEMSQQLEAWRNTLPAILQWSDDDLDQLLHTEHTTDPQLRRGSNLGDETPTIDSAFGLKLVQTTVRARFYYARIAVNLPSIYRALHDETPLSDADANRFMIAIQSACDLPLVTALMQNSKRLVPHHFSWIQSFTGTLLMLQIVSQSDQLRVYCEQRIGSPRLEYAVKLMLAWVRDMAQVDGIAEWSWKILEAIYSSAPR